MNDQHSSLLLRALRGETVERRPVWMMRQAGRVPLIGFAGAPLTLAAYMIEGHGSKTFDTFKSFRFAHPAATHELLDMVANELVQYLLGQVSAGANMLQLFDTWAGVLPEEE